MTARDEGGLGDSIDTGTDSADDNGEVKIFLKVAEVTGVETLIEVIGVSTDSGTVDGADNDVDETEG